MLESRVFDIKYKEIDAFLGLLHTQSVRELARRRGVPAGQISKLVSSLESKLGCKLFERSLSGVLISARGRELRPRLEKLMQAFTVIERQNEIGTTQKEIAIGGISLITAHLLPRALMQIELPDAKYQLVDLAPADLTTAGLLGVIDVCVHIGSLPWPKSWHTEHLADIRWVLVARENHSLARRGVRESQLKQWPFVYPIYWTKEGLHRGVDHCPLRNSQRIIGHETASAISAVELVANSDHLGFLPEFLVAPYIKRKELRRITIKKWASVLKPMYISVKSDRLTQKVFRQIRDKLNQEVQGES